MSGAQPSEGSTVGGLKCRGSTVGAQLSQAQLSVRQNWMCAVSFTVDKHSFMELGH